MNKLMLIILIVLFNITGQRASSEIIKYKDLVVKNGLYYKKFTDIPFSGKVKGQLNGNLKDGREHGLFERYYDSGQLESKGYYKNGKPSDGFYVSYKTNGQLKRKGYYENGEKVGFWIRPHKKEGGFWVQYFENGHLKSKEHWKGAKIIKKIKVQ